MSRLGFFYTWKLLPRPQGSVHVHNDAEAKGTAVPARSYV